VPFLQVTCRGDWTRKMPRPASVRHGCRGRDQLSANRLPDSKLIPSRLPQCSRNRLRIRDGLRSRNPARAWSLGSKSP